MNIWVIIANDDGFHAAPGVVLPRAYRTEESALVEAGKRTMQVAEWQRKRPSVADPPQEYPARVTAWRNAVRAALPDVPYEQATFTVQKLEVQP